MTETQGRPFWVHLVKTLGARRERARPYRARDEVYKSEEAADQADVKRQALTIEGKALIPDRLMAMTKGDPAAFLLPRPRLG